VRVITLSRADFFREQFPTLGKITYLNTAFCSPVASSVYQASQLFLDERMATPDAMTSWDETTEKTRHLVARMIGADSGEIAFATSAAMGTNIIAHGLSLGPGDNVVLDDLAYPTDSLLWSRMAEEQGFAARIVGNVGGLVPFDAVARAVDDGTKLISVSHVSYINGFRYDLRQLADLAHSYGAYLLSDSTQSVGAVRLDVGNADVDFVTCGAYKWLLGPIGVAFFYIKRELQERFPPLAYGWKQISSYAYSPDRTRAIDVERCGFFDDARRYEFASLNFHGLYGLRAALQLLEQIGLDWIEQRTLDVNRELRSRLLEEGFELFTPSESDSGITTFFVQDEMRLLQHLKEHGISVTARSGCGQLRVSPYFYNTGDEIALFVCHLVEWIKSSRSSAR
jgi:cysteine desulfurase/selenocysteine lyase